jgi:hypothetical protein
MVKTMDVHNSSMESGGYLKKAKINDLVRALRGMQPRSSWDDRTLSKKDRGVKMSQLNNAKGMGHRAWSNSKTGRRQA